MKRLIAWACTLCMLMGCMVLPASAATRDWTWPVPNSNTLSSCYGENRGSSTHYALDIAAGKGSSVVAAYGGKVIATYTSCSHNYAKNSSCGCGGDLGNYVYVLSTYNGTDYVSKYGHLTKVSVSNGQTVSKGQAIGTVGSTGYSTGFHLDFQLYIPSSSSYFTKSKNVDPLKSGLLSIPSGLNANAASTSCCYTYVKEVLAQDPTHTCNKGQYVYYWKAHPHYNCYKCSICGEVKEDRSSSNYVESCADCQPRIPSKTTPYTDSSTYSSGSSVKIKWNTVSGATYYWINIYKDKKQIVSKDIGNTSSYTLSATEPGSYEVCIEALNSAGTSGATSCYFTVGSTSVKFNANGGVLPSANASHPIDGINVGRGHEELIVYTQSGKTTDTNKWGREYAFDSQGRLTTVRGWGDDNQIKVPQDGFILSAQVDGAAGSDAGNFLIWTSTDGWYWGYDNQRAYAYDNLNAYLCHHKTVKNGSTYGTLPTINRDGYTFDGWYTSASGGTKITSSTKVTNSSNHTLYAHWTKLQVTPTNAKVKTDKSTYEPGDTVTVTPSATGASDYSISVFCGDEKVFSNYTGFTGSISFTAAKVGTYRVVVSCRNSAGYIDVTCSFTVQKAEEVPPVAPPATSTEIHFPRVATYTQGQFTDVPPSQWFTSNVANAVEFGLMKGNSSTTFNPYGDVTLAEAITMAARIHSIYTTGTESFDQSSGGKWYQVYLDYAYENGIIGNAYYTCDVTKKATRAQYAEIFANSLPAKGLEARNQVADIAIPDVPMSQSYADSVYKLYRAGILTGGDVLGTFSPETYITRAESATIVARMADTDNRMSFTLT